MNLRRAWRRWIGKAVWWDRFRCFRREIKKLIRKRRRWEHNAVARITPVVFWTFLWIACGPFVAQARAGPQVVADAEENSVLKTQWEEFTRWASNVENGFALAFFMAALALSVVHWSKWLRKPRRPTSSKSPPDVQDQWGLSTTLIPLSPRVNWTIADSFMGLLVVGATGAGKTTGLAYYIALAYLASGFGGLILTTKPGEAEFWRRLAQRAGRLSDLIVFDASCKHRFSFLDAELNRAGAGAGLTENIVALLMSVLEVAERSNGQHGHDGEAYWRRSLQQKCRNAIELLSLAEGRVTIPELYRLVVSAPTSEAQFASADWQRTSYCFECLQKADQRAKTPRELADFKLAVDYFTREFPNLSEKTRSVIVSTFTSLVDVLNRGLLRDLFCTDTNIRPEDTFQGKIVVIDLPVKEFLEVGQLAAVLWKLCWQRAVERRDVLANPRPVFLWADEFQNFTSSFDMQFQTTARSSRVATVYLTQNISTLHAAFGNESGKALTDSLAGNLQTKIFCQNGDPVTNEWASSIIGRTRQYFMNANNTHQHDWTSMFLGRGEGETSSAGMSEQMEFEVQPRDFTTLRTGGPQHNWLVDSIVFQGGRQFPPFGRTWLPVTVEQQR